MDPASPNLAALFEEEESGLLRYAWGLTGRRPVAEELVQEAFLRLHRSWGEVENPRAWLYRTVRNLALNHRRDHPLETELVADAAPGEVVQFERLGYFAADPDEPMHFHRTVGLRDEWAAIRKRQG